MHYQEILPAPHLTKYVKCFWVLQKTDNSIPNVTERVLPDGCLEIVFNLADRFRRYHSDGKIEIQPRTILVGQMRQSIQIEPLGAVNLFGIRFQTIGAYHFFKFSLNELTDKIYSLELILEKTEKLLEEQINEAQTTIERIFIIENFLINKLAETKSTDNPTEAVVENVLQNKGVISVQKISKEFGISQRQLERHFLQKVGVAPKFFCRLIRLQNILNALRSQPNQSLSNLALTYGYYDQSHFTHEFREFAGKSPSAFLQDENRMSELFSGS